MSEIDTTVTEPTDEELFQQLIGQLLGGSQTQPAPEIVERFDSLADTVNDVFDRLGQDGSGGNPDGYTVHFTSHQIRWVLSALGYFVQDYVSDDRDGAATALLDASETLLAAVNA